MTTTPETTTIVVPEAKPEGPPKPVDTGNLPDPKVSLALQEKAAAEAAEKAAREKSGEADGDPKVAKTPAELKAAEDATLAEAARIQKEKDDAAAKEKADWQKEYVKVENPDAQAAIDLMNEAGVSPIEANAIFAKAIESKDLNDVDWATLEAKIGPAKTRLVKNGVEKYHADVVSVQIEVAKKAFEIVGSEDNWKTVRAWAQTKEKVDTAYASKVAQYRKAIDLGGFTAEAAIRALKADFEADPKNGGLGKGSITKGDTIVTVTGGALTREQYITELHKLERSNTPGRAAATEALHNRRRLGMQQGI